MPQWFVEEFGDPCRECGYAWSTTLQSALDHVARAPARYASLLEGTNGSQRHPGLKWPAKSYVFHVADNLRIWSERLAAAVAGASDAVAPYDDNLLADARNYDRMPLEAALWALTRAADDWRKVVTLATEHDVRLVHPQRGTLTVEEIVLSNCHDVLHHEWDIARIRQVPPWNSRGR